MKVVGKHRLTKDMSPVFLVRDPRMHRQCRIMRLWASPPTKKREREVNGQCQPQPQKVTRPSNEQSSQILELTPSQGFNKEANSA